MSYRRQVSWGAALSDLRNDRVQYAPGERAAVCRANGYAKLAADSARLSARTLPLIVAGAYDRAAIMSAAIASAQARRAVTGEAWGVCLSAALKGTWQVAKAARRAAAH